MNPYLGIALSITLLAYPVLAHSKASWITRRHHVVASSRLLYGGSQVAAHRFLFVALPGFGIFLGLFTLATAIQAYAPVSGLTASAVIGGCAFVVALVSTAYLILPLPFPALLIPRWLRTPAKPRK